MWLLGSVHRLQIIMELVTMVRLSLLPSSCRARARQVVLESRKITSRSWMNSMAFRDIWFFSS